MIDIGPSQTDTNDKDCKHREIISAVVNKVANYV